MKNELWSVERIAELIKHVDKGELSAAGIGKLMGITRNAVLGKLFRLGITFKKAETLELERLKAERRKIAQEFKRNRQKIIRAQETGKQVKVFQPPEPELEFLGSLDIPFAELRLFSDLEENQCRYIAAEPPGPDYRVCGNRTEPGRAYCPRCWKLSHNISYVMPAPRRAA